jgi:uncharacterized protein (TIGR03435 family)
MIKKKMRFQIFSLPLVLGLVNAPHIDAQSTLMTTTPLPSFEVASIKPNRSEDLRKMVSFQSGRYTLTGLTTKLLITVAYDLEDFQVSGGPSWISSDRYDVNAKVEDSVAAEWQKLPPNQRAEQLRVMLQSLLADRFELKVSHTSKDLPIYALVVAKNGPKLQEAKPSDTYPNGIKGLDGRPEGRAGVMRMWAGGILGQGISLASLAELLSRQLSRTVTDQTGLKGEYDIKLQWTPDQMSAAIPLGPVGDNSRPDALPPPDSTGPSIYTAIQEQLGLRLESTKGPVEVLVIDHVERPSEN